MSIVRHLLLVGGSLVVCAAHAVSLTAAGYVQDFDSMGLAGTAPPAGWRLLTGEAGTSNTTWATSILANGASGSVASLVATAAALTATANPTANNVNGYNAAFSAAGTGDRVLATAPTGVSGAAIELSLSNDTGAAFSQIAISYDTRRFTAVTTDNELPGYQLFFSTNGASWTNVTALNPSLLTVPNSVGVTQVVNATVSLGGGVAAGQTLLLRWVDDNAVQTSPDQIIGLNNVSITAVPEPAMAGLWLIGLAVVASCFARRRTAGF